MISLFIEGAATAFFPCTLVLLLPGLAAAFSSRWQVALSLTSYFVGFTVVSWLVLTKRIGIWPPSLVAAIVGAATIAAWFHKGESGVRGTITPLLAGVAAAHLWEPCTGKAFGLLLNTLPFAGPLSLVRYSAYALGLVMPLGFIAIAAWLLPDKAKRATEKYFHIFGIGLLTIFTAALLTNTHTSIISQLSAWSSWD